MAVILVDESQPICKSTSVKCRIISRQIAPPKTNMSFEKGPFQKESSLPTIHFQVRTVSFREGKPQTFRNGEQPGEHPPQTSSSHYFFRGTCLFVGGVVAEFAAR